VAAHLRQEVEGDAEALGGWGRLLLLVGENQEPGAMAHGGPAP
jgi:hypothetical protein